MDKKAQWSLVAAAWVLALGVLGLGWLVLQKIPALHSAPGDLQPAIGSKVIDPVSKAEVLVAADSPHVSYQGRDYYFSSFRDGQGREAKTLFLMDPELYLSGVSSYKTPLEPAPTAAPPAATASPTAKAP